MVIDQAYDQAQRLIEVHSQTPVPRRPGQTGDLVEGNRYSYVAGAPVGLSDVSGMSPWDCIKKQAGRFGVPYCVVKAAIALRLDIKRIYGRTADLRERDRLVAAAARRRIVGCVPHVGGYLDDIRKIAGI